MVGGGGVGWQTSFPFETCVSDDLFVSPLPLSKNPLTALPSLLSVIYCVSTVWPGCCAFPSRYHYNSAGVLDSFAM